MAKLGLLHAVCTIGLLAATPVLAQSNTQTGATGVSGSTVVPTTHEAMPGGSSASGNSSGSASMGTKKPIHTTGGSSDGSTQAMMRNHPGHHAGMRTHSAMHPRNQANAQNTAVDMLNDQSYQAAQKGLAFGGSPAATGGMDKSGSMMNGSGNMMNGSGSMMNGGRGKM